MRGLSRQLLRCARTDGQLNLPQDVSDWKSAVPAAFWEGWLLSEPSPRNAITLWEAASAL